MLFVFVILTVTSSISQVKPSQTNNNVWYAKEFSKDIALFHAKNYLFRDILGFSNEIVKFEVIPLAAANSGELTTLLYKCESKEKEGLILGFFGNYWNDAGVVYQGYMYRNFNVNEANEFLNKIQEAIESNQSFLKNSTDNNNIYFKYEDIDILIWGTQNSYVIRLFWNNFDSSWDKTAFDRSKRRFEKKIK